VIPCFRGWLIAGTVYFAITIFMALPFVDLRQLDTATFGGDGRLVVWTIAWTNHAIRHGLPLFDANIFFPAQQSLAYTEHMLGLGILALPLTVATGNTVLACWVLWFAAFWTNAMAAHLLALRFTGRHDAAIAAGLVFGWAFFRMSHVGHLQLHWTAWLPLSLWLLERYHSRPTWIRLFAATAAIVMQMMTSWYLAVLAAFTSVGWFLWLQTLRPTQPIARLIDHFAVAGALAGAVMVPLAVPYLRASSSLQEPFIAAYEADLASYVKPPEDTWPGRVLERVFGVDGRWIWGEQTQFLGWIAIALAVIGFVAVVRRTRVGRDDWRQHAVPLFFVLLTVVAFWLSLGASDHYMSPFELLSAIPGFSLFRATARFGLLVMLGVAIMSAIGIAWCWTQLEGSRLAKLRPLLTIVLGLAMLAEWRVVTPVLRASPAPVPRVYELLNTLPAGAVVSLPDDRLRMERWAFRSDHLLYSTVHWRSIVNGYGRGEPPAYLDIITSLSTFPSAQAAGLARTLGVRYFVVHADSPDVRQSVADAQHSADFRLVAAFGSDFLFEVAGDYADTP
jgi:hypothetical protein